MACKSGLFFELIFSFCSVGATIGGGVSSQLFLPPFADPTIASETFEIPAAILAIFFFPEESAPPLTIGETFTPDNLLAGESEALRAGEACRLPFGDGCRYLDGTTIAGSFAVFLFSSRATMRLGTTHLDGAGDADLFTFPAGDGSLSAFATTGVMLLFFPTDADRLAPAGDENLEATLFPFPFSKPFNSSKFPKFPLPTLSLRTARGCRALPPPLPLFSTSDRFAAERMIEIGSWLDSSGTGWITNSRLEGEILAIKVCGAPTNCRRPGFPAAPETGRIPATRGTGESRSKRST